ncbi:MAG: hypothetical protein WDM76_04345 [Limisphaerales bacterium]
MTANNGSVATTTVSFNNFPDAVYHLKRKITITMAATFLTIPRSTPTPVFPPYPAVGQLSIQPERHGLQLSNQYHRAMSVNNARRGRAEDTICAGKNRLQHRIFWRRLVGQLHPALSGGGLIMFGDDLLKGAANTSAVLSQVASGFGTASQTVNSLGIFSIPFTGGWSTWKWALLKDDDGNPVKVRFDDSQATLRLGGTPIGGQPEVNVNFLMLVPAAPDPLTVVQAINSSLTNVQIVYSKPVEAASATNTANYIFTNGLAIAGASLNPDGMTVVLTTAPLVYGSNYSIVINGVRDRMNLPNHIATNTTIYFQALPYTLKDIGNPAVISTAVVAATASM